jgi:NAD(P)-dependent dehydrogenase (short-subunit alcohol dehydrogenase family)
MSGLEGKVALVTGAARGQGRAHALTLARNGADIIAVDIAGQIATVPYQMGTPDDLSETAKAYDMFAGHEGGTRDDLLAGAKSFHALKGAGVLSPQVLADAALWLVSDGAAAVTGVALPVDAGHMLLTGVNPAPAD